LGSLLKKYGLENFSEKEKEELKQTVDHMLNVAEIIQTTIRMMDYCDEKNILVSRSCEFKNIRNKELDGMNIDISKLKKEMKNLQTRILSALSREEKEGMREYLKSENSEPE